MPATSEENMLSEKELLRKQKKAILGKKRNEKLKEDPRYLFIKNILVGSRKKIDTPDYKPSKPSIDKWNKFEIVEKDLSLHPGLFEKWSKLFQKLNDDLVEKSKPPVCLIQDTDDEDEGKEETKENFVEPEEEPKEEPKEKDSLDFLDDLSEKFYQFATTKEEDKKPFDNRQFAKYMESFDTVGLELAKQYIEMKLKYPFDKRFIYSEEKTNAQEIYFTSEDVRLHIENRTDCSESHKKSQLNYYKRKEDKFSSNDLYVDSPFILKIIDNPNFRESVKQFLTAHKFHENVHFKDAYNQLENYRKEKKHESTEKVESRTDTEPLKLTYGDLIELTETFLTPNSNICCPYELIISRMYHLNDCHIRNDFHEIHLKKPNNNKKANYLDLKTKKFHLNVYKTEGKAKHGEKIYKIDDLTIDFIKDSLKDSPRKYLFSSKTDPNKPMTPGECSKYLRDPIKRLLDTSMTISDLRAAHATWANRVYPDGSKVLSLAEREKIADYMCHSLEMQQTTYLRKASIETIPFENSTK